MTQKRKKGKEEKRRAERVFKKGNNSGMNEMIIIGKMRETRKYEFLTLYRGVNVVKEKTNREISLSTNGNVT